MVNNNKVEQKKIVIFSNNHGQITLMWTKAYLQQQCADNRCAVHIRCGIDSI